MAWPTITITTECSLHAIDAGNLTRDLCLCYESPDSLFFVLQFEAAPYLLVLVYSYGLSYLIPIFFFKWPKSKILANFTAI